MNVAETVRAAQNGDKQAMEELYKNYIGEIKTIAKCYFPNEDHAEDAASEIFLLVMQKIGTIENPAAFHGWLRKVIEHKCISILRKKREFTMDDEEYIENCHNTDTGNFSDIVPHEKLDNTETQKIIYNIVSELPEKHKSVILMYYYSNMSVESIAKVLGISEGTVKSRLSHARDKIEKKIKSYERKGIKLYSVDILKSLGQIISNISQNTQVTTNFSTVMNSIASSSSTFTSAVSTITTTQVSNIVSTSVARTISNATATRISVVASAVVIATCTAVTQLPPTDAQITPEIQTSIIHEVEEVPVIQGSIVYVPSEVVSTIYDTSIIHDTSVIETTVTETNTIHDTSTIYDTSIIHDISTVYETSVIENTVYVEIEKPSAPKDHSISHYEEDGIFRYKVYDNANEVTLVSVVKVPEEVMETLEIPQEINGVPVTAIGHHALNNQQFFENVKIGGNIQEIENSAFEKSSLKSIELNDNITEIASRTFFECSHLENVINAENIEIINEKSFAGTALKDIGFLGSNLRSVYDGAFAECNNMTGICIPDTIEYIGDEFCPVGVDITVKINMEHFRIYPDVYRTLKDTWLDNASIVTIVFTGGIKEITESDTEKYVYSPDFFDENLSWYFYNDTEVHVELTNDITRIGKEVFSGCLYLTEIILPSGLLEIGENAFKDCTSLTKIHFPDQLERIEQGAFLGCSSLEQADFPDSLKYIGEGAFADAPFHSLALPSGLTYIGGNAFESFNGQNGTFAKELIFPDSLEYIGDYAFYGCCDMQKVVITAGVTEIGEENFYNDGTDSTSVIYGIQGSYAQQYAEEHDLKFVPVEAENDTSGENGDFSSLL